MFVHLTAQDVGGETLADAPTGVAAQALESLDDLGHTGKPQACAQLDAGLSQVPALDGPEVVSSG